MLWQKPTWVFVICFFVWQCLFGFVVVVLVFGFLFVFTLFVCVGVVLKTEFVIS